MVNLGTNKFEFDVQPSQWVNIGWLIFAVACWWLYFPPVLLLWYYAVISCWHYEFRERTIAERKGVFSTDKVEIHYFRIKSIKIEKPFLMRLVGLSNIVIITSDPFRPILRLYAIHKGEEIRVMIKDLAYHWRHELNVKEHDLFEL
jgi:membrane protein YdbS with pleckstrin-like domain